MIYRIWHRNGQWQGQLHMRGRARLRFYAKDRHELFRQMGVWLERVVNSDR